MMSVRAELTPQRRLHDQRRAKRHKLRLLVPGSVPSEGALEVLIHDLSPTGILIESSTEVSHGETIDLIIPEVGSTPARVVWISGRYLGCEFKTPISSAAVSAALLRAPIPLDESPVELSAPLAVEHETQFDDPNELSHFAKIRIVLGISVTLWAIIIWSGMTLWQLFAR